MRPLAPSARVRGIAFVLVLWVIAMLSILLGTFAVVARTENLQSRHLFDTTQARCAAEAGLNLAVYELRKNDTTQRWVGDGRPYRFGFGDAKVEVRLTDDSGKIDINTADGPTLKALFMAQGVDPDKADALADAIQDYREPGDLPRLHGAKDAEYKAAGLTYGPKKGPFDTVSELQQVYGMTYDLYAKVEPAVTIYSGSGRPNPAYAPLQALLALPGMTQELAQQIIQERQAIPPGQPGATGLVLPDGQPVVAGGGGLTYSVKSRATLPNGASTVLDATIRLGGINPAGRPFVVLRWRDGETS